MDLPDYYSARAPVYEEMYRRDDPPYQAELAALTERARELLGGRRVLDVACGTGWWEAQLAESVEHITGIDLADGALAVARAKRLPVEKVEFRSGDAFELDHVHGRFNAGLATFWLSHVERARLKTFLAGLHRRLEPGSVLLLADNVLVPGIGGEQVIREGCADTFKRRLLPNGTEVEVLKNYYTEPELWALCEDHAAWLEIEMGRHCWWAAMGLR